MAADARALAIPQLALAERMPAVIPVRRGFAGGGAPMLPPPMLPAPPLLPRTNFRGGLCCSRVCCAEACCFVWTPPLAFGCWWCMQRMVGGNSPMAQYVAIFGVVYWIVVAAVSLLAIMRRPPL